jgi:hypothetical protein
VLDTHGKVVSFIRVTVDPLGKSKNRWSDTVPGMHRSSCIEKFSCIHLETNKTKTFKVEASMMEIYNEKRSGTYSTRSLRPLKSVENNSRVHTQKDSLCRSSDYAEINRLMESAFWPARTIRWNSERHEFSAHTIPFKSLWRWPRSTSRRKKVIWKPMDQLDWSSWTRGQQANWGDR